MSARDRLLQDRPVLLDGATGSEIHRRGIDTRLPLWSAAALIDVPETVARIHADHVTAGAEIVTANTFRTKRRTLARAGVAIEPAELVRRAVELARAARPQFVAGSIGPLEDCYSPQLVPSDVECAAEHAELARDLADAGADLLLVETMNTAREAAAAARAAVATGLPTIVSFVCGSDGLLLSGETVAGAAEPLLALGVDALAINCTPTPTLHEPLAELLRAAAGRVPCGAWGNVGRTDSIQGWTCTEDVSPAEYADRALRWLDLGARIVGGCCGTTPDHIAALRAAIDAR